VATSGARGAIDALGLIMTAGAAAATPAAEAMGEAVAREARSQLSRSSHPPGTPTTSMPGSPPATVTGRLRDSVEVRVIGEGAVQVGATAPYARIQELGGTSGRGGATELPSRPYLIPAWEIAGSEAYEVALEVIREAVSRG